MQPPMRLAVVPFLALLGAIAMPAAPTYNKDIAPILYKNCAGCHRPGEVAPFSLLTYADTAKRAALIATVTKARVMPPWKAEPGHGEFQDARRLTDEQIVLLQQWAGNGAPEGDAADRPTPPAFASGWQLGQPDRVLTVPAKYSVPPDGPDQFRCFVIPLNLDEDAYVGAMEFRADDRRTVHHALFFTDPPTKGRTVVLVGTNKIDIPPGDSHYVVRASVTMPADGAVLRITPHAHYVCKDMKVDAYLPDGSVTPLIWIKDWDLTGRAATLMPRR